MLLATLSAIFFLTAKAQQNIADPINNFCRRHQHQTCVIDSKLYIDGGLVYYGGSVSSDSEPQTNTWLIWEDLTNSTSDFPPQYSNLTKGKEVPSVSGGVLWPDQINKLFYLFGGEYKNDSVQDFTSLWLYDTIYNTWNRSITDGSQMQVSWPAFGAGTVNDEGIGYYYGGYLSDKSVSDWTGDSLMLNSLVSFDMNTNKWSNFTSGDRIPRAEGTIHYIPASDRGMLVYFGGVEGFSDGTISFANMSQIRLYDIASIKWYTQTATGDIPQARRGFCAGITWAEDHSSYNIYIFGGIGTDGTALGDVYILSLPSFKWISWYPDPQMTTFPGGKAWASCDVIGQSQMIIMSGYLTNTSKPDCDTPIVGGQHGLLLGQESIEENNLWHRYLTNISEYRVPQNVTGEIGGGTDGKATETAPADGWATSDLSIYFRTTYAAASRTAIRPIPTPSATGSAPSDRSHTNIGAIIGGAVGGAAMLVGVIVLVFCCLRSRRQKQNIQKQVTAAPSSTIHQHHPISTEKSVASVAESRGDSAIHSPYVQSPAYSPHGSPPLSDHRSSTTYYQESPLHHQMDWSQQREYGFVPSQLLLQHGYQQTYYPPPPDPSLSPSGHSGHTMSVELPGVKSPATAELPDVRSPVPIRSIQ